MAFSVPIWVRSSLIMRVMVVTQTRAAISAKKMGKALATAVIMVMSFSKVTRPALDVRSRVKTSSFSRSSVSFTASAYSVSASSSFARPSASSCSASALPSLYSVQPWSTCFWASSSCFFASSSCF